MNKPDIIETLKAEGIEVKRNKFLCPFHDDHKPSASIRNNNFKCWACGEGGDVYDFLMKYHGLDFKGALSYSGIERSGRPFRPDPVKARIRAIKRIYDHWKQDYCLYLADLLRCLDQAKALCNSMDDVEELAEYYHKATAWELEYSILISNDEDAKFKMFREVYDGKNN